MTFCLGLLDLRRRRWRSSSRSVRFCNDLKLEMSDEKTLITHAREETARFLGYEIHVLHADDRCDRHGHRCLNGRIGLRVPGRVVAEHCSAYKQHGKAIHLSERVNDSVHDIVTRYQAEYRGLVQYYRMAYNLHTMSELRQTMGLSLVKTLAKVANALPRDSTPVSGHN